MQRQQGRYYFHWYDSGLGRGGNWVLRYQEIKRLEKVCTHSSCLFDIDFGIYLHVIGDSSCSEHYSGRMRVAI